MSVSEGPNRPSSGKHTGYNLQTVERASQVLELLLKHDAFTLKDTCRELGLNTTIAYRLLQTWVQLGYLYFDSKQKTYQAGAVLHHLSAKIDRQSQLSDIEQRLKRLSDAVGQTSNVGVLIGTNMVYVARNVVRKVLMYNVEVGTLLPAHATSMGRILLAHKPEAYIRKLYPDEALVTFTPHTTATVGDLLNELRLIREQGYAISTWQLQIGVTSVAVPLRDLQGDVLAAINVAGTSLELTEEFIHERVLPALRDAAQKPIGRSLFSLPALSRHSPLMLTQKTT